MENKIMYEGINIVNLTPHDVVLIVGGEKLVIPKCLNPPRLVEERKEIGKIGNIAIYSVSYKVPDQLLPPQKDGTIYIVPARIAEVCRGRTDLYVPDKTIRDEKGNIIGCEALARI